MYLIVSSTPSNVQSLQECDGGSGRCLDWQRMPRVGGRGGAPGRQRPLLHVKPTIRTIQLWGSGGSAFVSVKRKRKKENIPRPVTLNGFWSRIGSENLVKAVMSSAHRLTVLQGIRSAHWLPHAQPWSPWLGGETSAGGHRV